MSFLDVLACVLAACGGGYLTYRARVWAERRAERRAREREFVRRHLTG
jgi:hypothetical protein